MKSTGAILRLVLRRARSNRRLLSTVLIGVVLASALLASVVIYSDAVRDLGLSYALRDQPDRALDLRVLSSNRPASPELYDERKETIDRLVETQAGEVLSETVHYGKTDTFFPVPPGELADTEDPQRARANFQFIDDFEERVDLVEGGERREARLEDGVLHLDAWLSVEAAEQLDVAVGDVYDLHAFWVRDVRPVRVTVTGLFEPKDPGDREWYDTAGRFIVTTTSWPTYPFWTDEATVTGPMADYLPDLSGSFETYGIVDRGAITSGNAERIEQQVRGLGGALGSQLQLTSLESTLAGTIESYRERLFFTRLPLFALMLQVVGIVLYYLVMVSGMVVDRQLGEIALLRSRGASSRQVMSIYAMEGGLLAIAGTVLGPLFAAGTIALLGFTPSFNELSGNNLLSVSLSPLAFGLAAFGALMGMVALLVPAYQATRKSMVHYKQNLARPPQQPVFLRYYLDLAVVAIAAYAFYQLRERGSLVTDRLFGGLSADPLLLIAPTLFMLMVALVFLRLFPLVLGIASWAGRGLRGATIPLGLWHMVRMPTHYGRLILLLLLATAVGMFAAGFRATLERSYDDRSAYEAGAPARIEGLGNQEKLPPGPFVDAMRETTGSQDFTPVLRTSGSFQQSQFRFESFETLAVVPEEFERIANWRSDFAPRSLEGIMEAIDADDVAIPHVAEVPTGTEWIGVWAQPGYDLRAGLLVARLVDEDGAFWEYRMLPVTEPDADGWMLFAADLEQPSPRRSTRAPGGDQALYLDSLVIRISGIAGAPVPVSVVFDEFVASTTEPGGALEDAEIAVVEGFSDLEPYVELRGVGTSEEPATLTRVETGQAGDGLGARLDFVFQQGHVSTFGLRTGSDVNSIPAAVSNTFLSAAGVSVGDQLPVYLNRQIITLDIVARFEYFPTWDPKGGSHLVVTDLGAMATVGSRIPLAAEGAVPNGIWLMDPARTLLDREMLQEAGLFPDTIAVESMLRAEAGADPLVAASWEGILFLSFAAVLLLTALGFVVYSYLTAQTRSLEFAILRTMGFSGRQILGLVSFEQVFVILSGIVVGTLLGMPLGRLMIGYMGVTETGEDILPPLVSQISWGAVVTVYTLLGLVFVFTVLALVTLYSRLAVHRALRMGEL